MSSASELQVSFAIEIQCLPGVFLFAQLVSLLLLRICGSFTVLNQLTFTSLSPALPTDSRGGSYPLSSLASLVAQR